LFVSMDNPEMGHSDMYISQARCLFKCKCNATASIDVYVEVCLSFSLQLSGLSMH